MPRGEGGTRAHGATLGIQRAALPALALAALAAFYLKSLGHPSLWLDEAWEANYYVGLAASPWYNRPILYMGAERLMARLFGPSEFVLRLLPCVAGLAAVAATWRLACRTLGRSCAWLAAGLLAIAPTFLYQAHQLKHYTFDALFTVLLLLAYLRYREKASPGRLGLFALTALVSFGFSFTSIFVLAAIGIAHAVGWAVAAASPASSGEDGAAPASGAHAHARDGASAGRVRLVYLGVNVLLLLAFAGVYAAFHASAQSDTLLKEYFAEAWAPLSTPVALPGWVARQTRVLAEIAGASSFAAFALLLLAGAWGERASDSALAHAREPSRGALPVLTTTLLASLLILIATSAVHLYPYGSARLTLFLAPLVCTLAAAGMLEALGVSRRTPGAGGHAAGGVWPGSEDAARPSLGRPPGAWARMAPSGALRAIAVAGLLYVLMYPAIAGARPYLTHGWGTDGLRQAIDALAREHRLGEGIYVPERAMASFPFYWWRAGKGTDVPDVIQGERHRLHPGDHAAQIERIAEARRRLWVVWYDQSRSERDLLREFLLDRYESARRIGDREAESIELFRLRDGAAPER